jgi:hypothetical protein
MAELTVGGAALGTELQNLLLCDDIVPGAEASYQVCKTIYLWHPLGGKIAEAPIRKAMSQKRKISVPDAPEDRVKTAFENTWKSMKVDRYIRNAMRLARIYGISTVAAMIDDDDASAPLDYKKLGKQDLTFNVFDPLNTAGSLVLNQNPNAKDFLKPVRVSINGQAFHPTRTCVMMNEEPIYLAYTSSAFGFVGRSVYQRALFPLKSFVNTMIADDMVARKAGVIIAKLKAPGSIIDNIMARMAGIKRTLLKEAETNNVMSIEVTEEIESLNLINVNSALMQSRKDILENIAAATPMPAQMINSETFAEGFGEGTEDSKNVAQYIDGLREDMEPLYEFFTPIVQHKAWSEEFYATIQDEFPEYKKIPHNTAFYQWKNSFTAEWPSLLIEPESEQAKAEDVRLKAILALVEILMPALDPDNKATVIEWCCDNFNSLKLLFASPLTLDFDQLIDYTIEQMVNAEQIGAGDEGPKEPAEPKPFAAQDELERPGMKRYNDAVAEMIQHKALREKRKRLQSRASVPNLEVAE